MQMHSHRRHLAWLAPLALAGLLAGCNRNQEVQPPNRNDTTPAPEVSPVTPPMSPASPASPVTP